MGCCSNREVYVIPKTLRKTLQEAQQIEEDRRKELIEKAKVASRAEKAQREVEENKEDEKKNETQESRTSDLGQKKQRNRKSLGNWKQL